jgi:hypothetical protein
VRFRAPLQSALLLDHTRVDASSDFNGTANVPKIAITIYYFAVQENCFAGLGQNKADIIKKEQFRKTSALKFPLRFCRIMQIPLLF